MSDSKALTVSNPLAPATFAEAQKFAEILSKSDFVPAAYKGKPGDIMIAMQMGAEVGLPPLAALQNIAVIRGKPTIWGDAVPAIAMSHPSFDGLDETFDEKTMTATCKVRRKGMAEQVRTFSKSDAEAAGLWGKDTWKSYPKRMLQMRARGFAMRDVFPDALKGLITREEAEDYQTVKIVNAEPSKAEPIAEQAESPPAAAGHPPRQPPPGVSETPPPTEKPSMPYDPEEGEKGITLEQWNAAVEFGYECADLEKLAEWFLSLKRAYGKTKARPDPVWTEKQEAVLVAFKDEMKTYLGAPSDG